MWSSAKSKMLVRREILHSTPSCWYFFVEYPIEKYRKFHSKSFLKRPREKYVHSRNLECDHLLQFNTAPLDSGAVNNESGRDTLKARHLAPINGGLRLFFTFYFCREAWCYRSYSWDDSKCVEFCDSRVTNGMPYL